MSITTNILQENDIKAKNILPFDIHIIGGWKIS